MNFQDIAEALGALARIVADRGGDRSALSATEALLRAEAETKPADFYKIAKKALKNGARLPKAIEVRASAAAQGLAALSELLSAAGVKDSSLKTIVALREFLEEHGALSLDAIAEAIAAEREAAAQKPTRKGKAA